MFRPSHSPISLKKHFSPPLSLATIYEKKKFGIPHFDSLGKEEERKLESSKTFQLFQKRTYFVLYNGQKKLFHRSSMHCRNPPPSHTIRWTHFRTEFGNGGRVPTVQSAS